MILGVLLVDHAWTMKVYVIPCVPGARANVEQSALGATGCRFRTRVRALDASEREGNRFGNFFFSDVNHDFGRFSENS